MERFTETAKEYAGEIWFPIIIGLCNAADTFILIVPNDILIGAAVLAQPQRWFFCAIAQTLGCSLGCVLFCILALYNPDGIKDYFPSVFQSDAWGKAESYYKDYGLITAVIGGGLLPFHPFLFVGALSGLSTVKLVTAITLGRLVRNVGICYTLAKAPNFSVKSFFANMKSKRKRRNRERRREEKVD